MCGGLFQRDGEAGLTSLCTWSQDVDALLPRTDKVGFVTFDDAGQPRQEGMLDWDQVEAAAGCLMQL